MKKIILLFAFIATTINSFAQAGAALFTNLQVHTIQLNFTQPNYWSTLVSNKAYDDANDSSSQEWSKQVNQGQKLFIEKLHAYLVSQSI